MIESAVPENATLLRDALYRGRIFKIEGNAAAHEVATKTRVLLRDALGDSPRTAARELADDEFFTRIGSIRRTLYLEADYHGAVRRILTAIGQDVERTAFDPLRLRVILDQGHERPVARAVYYPHRDTWYGHPRSLVAVWIAIDDLEEHETFVFYPECFDRPVPNDSEIFDYDEWVSKGWSLKIGWQDKKAGLRARYPGVVGEFDGGREVGFTCRRGDVLLFSGAHFHRTRPQSTGLTRFSLDFRFVDLDDVAADRGAPNVDNRSRGSALRDYVGSAGVGDARA